jgi:hypothetical protein
MAGAKRMSAEEKRKAVLAIYHASKSVYTEKEILILAAKAGVNSNTYVCVCGGERRKHGRRDIDQ